MIRRIFSRWRPTAAGTTTRSLRQRLSFALAAILLLLFGGALGFYLAFPSEALRQHLQQEAARRWQLEVKIARIAPLPTLGVSAEQITLNLPGLPLAIEQITVRPLWSTLLGSNPGVTFSARLFGGETRGALRRHGDFLIYGGPLELDLPLPRSAGLRVHGQLRDILISGAQPPRPTGEMKLQLVLDGCHITGVKTMGLSTDRLDLGRITLTAAGRGNSLAVQQLSAEGGALLGSGEGTLLLSVPTEQTRLNLTLSLRPTPGLDPLLKDLLSLLATPAADGSIRFRLSGTLAAPLLQQ